MSGVSVLHLGAWYGFDDIVEASLEAGSDINGWANDQYMTRWMHHRMSGKTLFPRNSDIYRSDMFFSGSHVTPLYLAARAGHEGIVRQLLAAGADVNATKSIQSLGGVYDGVTALHTAAARGHVATVRLLINDAKCRVNSRTTDGTTPLHCAVEGCHLAAVRALLDHKPPTNETTVKPRPFTSPAIFSNSPIAKQLLGFPKRLLFDDGNTIDINANKTYMATTGVTALHLAASFGTEDISRELVRAGAAVNARTSDGSTPLHMAAYSGAGAVATLLLAAGAETEVGAVLNDCVGLTPLLMAAKEGRSEVIERLINFGRANLNATCTVHGVPGIGVVHLTAVYNQGDATRTAIELGADVDATTANGTTALQLAVAERSEESVEALVGAGCRLSEPERVGLIHVAVAHNSQRMVRALVRIGCDVNEIATTADGVALTPLCLAVAERVVDMVDTLIELGCDVGQRLPPIDNGVTALHSAAEHGLLDIARLLIDAGADINTTATYGDLSHVTPVHLAVTNGHAEMVELLSEHSANVELAAIDSSDATGCGFSPLYLAVKSRNTAAVKSLLKKGCNVSSSPRHDGWTPLHAASEDGATEIVLALLDAGCDVTITASFNDSRGVLALHQAAQQGHADIVDLLVTIGGCDVDARKSWRHESGISALHLAAEASHVTVVRHLVALGADVNAAKSTGWTALHWAARNGSVVMAEALLRAGAHVDPEVVSSGERVTPLDMAAENGHIDLVKLLIDAGANYDRTASGDQLRLTALHRAAMRGHVDIVRLLSSGRPELVGTVDRNGYTALHYAAQGGHVDVTKTLIARQSPLLSILGISPLTRVGVQRKIGNGSTSAFNSSVLPIHLAAAAGHSVVCRFLVAAGCPVDAPTDHVFPAISSRPRSTSLMISSAAGHATCVSALVELGADVDAVDGDGLTALHSAAACNSSATVDCLVAAGVDTNSGRSVQPIHFAVLYGCVENVRSLLKAGCDVNATTKGAKVGSCDRMTALHLAVENGRHDLVRLLVQHQGIDVTLRSADGNTPLDVATIRGQGDICRTLKKRMHLTIPERIHVL